MARQIRFSFLLFGGLTLAACAGGESMDDTAMADEGMVAMDAAASSDLACFIARGTMAEAQERPSPLRETRFMVGGTEALLCYGAPSARGREIMGGLLPFGNLERIGANEATALHLSGPANVGNVALDAGSYSLYAMPGEAEGTFYRSEEHTSEL